MSRGMQYANSPCSCNSLHNHDGKCITESGQRSFGCASSKSRPGNQASCSRPGLAKFDSTWQITETDVKNLPHISQTKSADGIRDMRIEHPETYYRQYIGLYLPNRKNCSEQVDISSSPPIQ